MKKTVLMAFACLFFTGQHASAQLLDKVVGGGKGKKTESSSEQKSENKPSSNKGFKLKGEDDINKEFTEDEYGLSGIYYYKNESGVFISKLDFAISDKMSTEKGAENIPEGVKYSYSIAYEDRGMLKVREDDNNLTSFICAFHLLNFNELYLSTLYTSAPLLQLEPGVLMLVPKANGEFVGPEAPAYQYQQKDWQFILENGTIFVKNKEDLAKWENPDLEKTKTKIMSYVNNINACYKDILDKTNTKNEMPTLGKLNTKFIQDRALKTYNEKYNSINKGWTHRYMYVHGNEWVNKFKTNEYGLRVESHRELQVVIVRTSPKGECRADLMLYVEPFSNGKYDDQSGYVMGPTSYIGMPGGILPCEKSKAFESKLIK